MSTGPNVNDLIARINIEIERDIELANGEDEQAHNERHWPDRIERQTAAFRKILELHQPYAWLTYEGCATCGVEYGDPPEYMRADWPCPTLLVLADIYGIEHR